MTHEEKFHKEVWFVLNKIKRNSLYKSANKALQYKIYTPFNAKKEGAAFKIDERGVINKLKDMGAIKLVDPAGQPEDGEITLDQGNTVLVSFYYLETLEPKFSQLYEEYESKQTFSLEVIDNEIWVNDYLIAKPHAVGTNFSFFEYIRSLPANTLVTRDSLPDQGKLSLKQQVRTQSFFKIMNAMGFKGELLKLFFSDRSANSLKYRGDKISLQEAKSAGINVELLEKELHSNAK